MEPDELGGVQAAVSAELEESDIYPKVHPDKGMEAKAQRAAALRASKEEWRAAAAATDTTRVQASSQRHPYHVGRR